MVNKSSDRSCTRGMIHNKMYLIIPGFLRPSIASQNRIMAYNTLTHSIHLIAISLTIYISFTQRMPAVVPHQIISYKFIFHDHWCVVVMNGHNIIHFPQHQSPSLLKHQTRCTGIRWRAQMTFSPNISHWTFKSVPQSFHSSFTYPAARNTYFHMYAFHVKRNEEVIQCLLPMPSMIEHSSKVKKSPCCCCECSLCKVDQSSGRSILVNRETSPALLTSRKQTRQYFTHIATGYRIM